MIEVIQSIFRASLEGYWDVKLGNVVARYVSRYSKYFKSCLSLFLTRCVYSCLNATCSLDALSTACRIHDTLSFPIQHWGCGQGLSYSNTLRKCTCINPWCYYLQIKLIIMYMYVYMHRYYRLYHLVMVRISIPCGQK